MILFENNTKLFEDVEEKDFHYDPLSELKLELDWTEQKLEVFEECMKFDYLEVYRRNNLITESDYISLSENAAANVISKIGRVIRNIILTIKDTIIGAFRKLSNYFKDKAFQKTLKKFKENDLSSFKIKTLDIDFSMIEEFAKPGYLFDLMNGFTYEVDGKSIAIKDLGSLFDNLSDEEKEDLIKGIKEKDEEIKSNKNFSKVFDATDEEFNKLINSDIIKSKKEIYGFTPDLKSKYIKGYDNCRKAIEYSIQSYEKLIIAYKSLENSFTRNTKRSERTGDEYAAILKILSNNRTYTLKLSKIFINTLNMALKEIMKVMKEGAVGVIKAEDDPIKANIKEATDEVDKIEDINDAIEEPEDIEGDEDEIEEFAKSDISEFESLMEIFSSY